MRGGTFRALLGVGALALLLAACGGPREHEGPPPVPVSPNGEPLLGAQPGTEGCEAAEAAWLAAADMNHDGVVDRTEFMADAQRWFATVDENKDGTITPDELTTLRLRLMPPAQRAAETRGENDRQRALARRRGYLGADLGRASATDRPDPVMSADVNLDNRVSHEEFQAQAARTFASLDRNRDGHLSRDEVVATCAVLLRR
jgi:Ca2+-binding EF-hand superfamily protein